MSIGAQAIGEGAVGGQEATNATAIKKPPKNRLVVAKADAIAQPEAR
jgi:hypothetical protein